MLKLNVDEVDAVTDIPGHSTNGHDNENDVAEEAYGKRKNGDLQPNIRRTKRQRMTRSKKARSLKLDLGRDNTVLDLKKQVCKTSTKS